MHHFRSFVTFDGNESNYPIHSDCPRLLPYPKTDGKGRKVTIVSNSHKIRIPAVHGF
jgi:hypothetical protein